MAFKRLSMRKIHRVLRLFFEAGLSIRAIARSIQASPSTVGDYIRRAHTAGLSWPLPEKLDERALEARLFPIAQVTSRTRRAGRAPQYPWCQLLPITDERTLNILTHPTVDKLHQLRCTGMAKALAEQFASPEVDALSFEERLGLLVDRELTERYSRQLTNRLRRARLKHDACIEDIDFRHRRGLDKDLVLSLADGRWVREHLNVLITGSTGVGKTWVACALAHSACRHGHSATYLRLPRASSAHPSATAPSTCRRPTTRGSGHERHRGPRPPP